MIYACDCQQVSVVAGTFEIALALATRWAPALVTKDLSDRSFQILAKSPPKLDR